MMKRDFDKWVREKDSESFRKEIEKLSKEGDEMAKEIIEETKPKHGEYFGFLIEVTHPKHGFPLIKESVARDIAKRWNVLDLFEKTKHNFQHHLIS